MLHGKSKEEISSERGNYLSLIITSETGELVKLMIHMYANMAPFDEHLCTKFDYFIFDYILIWYD